MFNFVQKQNVIFYLDKDFKTRKSLSHFEELFLIIRSSLHQQQDRVK